MILINNILLETRKRKFCRINQVLYNVEDTSKCYVCKHYYHFDNIIYQTHTNNKPFSRRNNTCTNCFHKIIKIQKFLVYHRYNPLYKVCQSITNKKYDNLINEI